MKQYYLFTVNDKSWEEHISTGIVAINDPGRNPNNRQGNAQRQKALCEVASIKKGDLIFFYYQGTKKIKGLYEAYSTPFYDTSPLKNGGYINEKFPIRIEFKQKINFEEDLDMEDIWHSKDRGFFWSIQQQRGDSVGRHACITLTKEDGDHLTKMFYEKNTVLLNPIKISIKNHSKSNLPFDYKGSGTELHYEAVLQSILLQDLRAGKFKEILGEYDYIIPFFPTSSQKEIDILLFKHQKDEVLWYEILELKQSKFTKTELDKLMRYEDWLIKSLSLNPRNVHSVAIANQFDEEVKKYIRGRIQYGGKKIRLIRYEFDGTKEISLKEEKI